MGSIFFFFLEKRLKILVHTRNLLFMLWKCMSVRFSTRKFDIIRDMSDFTIYCTCISYFGGFNDVQI